ncbi:GIY-YIG nuclease family protein [Marinobacter sp.]|uniref:GIY-YIG nuclease family protein n=1 Tax=Marinobacter sp. TaxID=50741 RepID=UPI003A8D7ACB
MTRYIYLIENQYRDVKVGVTTCPERRLRSLELAGNLDIVQKFVVESRLARRFEKKVLSKFSEYRAKGEWFSGVDFRVVKEHLETEIAQPLPEYDLKHISDPRSLELVERVLFDN